MNDTLSKMYRAVSGDNALMQGLGTPVPTNALGLGTTATLGLVCDSTELDPTSEAIVNPQPFSEQNGDHMQAALETEVCVCVCV